MSRPLIESIVSPDEFNRYYWLRTELAAFCRSKGMSARGSKQELSDRITFLLKEGRRPPVVQEGRKVNSDFDWSKELLTPQTIITDSYKNGKNARAFFQQQIGPHFTFNVRFIQWMRDNTGKTLHEAVDAWKAMESDKDSVTIIAPQFQYNQYMRDFLADNPSRTPADARSCWNKKKQLPAPHRYEPGDLTFL